MTCLGDNFSLKNDNRIRYYELYMFVCTYISGHFARFYNLLNECLSGRELTTLIFESKFESRAVSNVDIADMPASSRQFSLTD